ncbi:DUF3500 domain-containing protein [Umezawaea sp. Da 62-37]|uniref:DUF3500 domain-containing protein n=1 Tax=Umezawaea sp. Da 62-37 TaxID=3075927 RepID=UPI0028F700E1|nr:DUF3500 domain-containing protein [Umezawaea sp. Da 62-37]WNV82973.1 DUF3500 domain-containing protein [Umezawaea sp. Da 62-37]
MPEDFRDYVMPLHAEKIAGIGELDAYQWVERHLQQDTFRSAVDAWTGRFAATSFRGITTDGTIDRALFPRRREDAPTAEMVAAAGLLLGTLDDRQRSAVRHPLDSRVWRAWMNPELYVNRFGLRLDEVSGTVREAVLGLIRASLSEAGFDKVRKCMWTNDFLGRLVHGPRVMNEFSYNFNLFGEPSEITPWGWSLYGHHVCVNVMVVGTQMVASPVFLGAEPNIIDEGPHAGTRLFGTPDELALELLHGLPKNVRDAVVLYPDKRHSNIPPGREVFGDELHLAGMFQDNRVIPYEGGRAADFPTDSRELLLRLAGNFVDHLPPGPYRARLDDIRAHLDDTWLCWIGGSKPDSPFYLRIQSPVILIEYEHHAGIMLTNTNPAKFHTHTIMRTPNGNDYGAALVAQEIGQQLTFTQQS